MHNGVIYRRVGRLGAFLPAFLFVQVALRHLGKFQGFTGFSKVPGLYRIFQSSRALQDFPKFQVRKIFQKECLKC
jgi:hypothetical protein